MAQSFNINQTEFNRTILDHIIRTKERRTSIFEFRNRNLTAIPKELSEQCSWLKTVDLSHNNLKEIPEHLKTLNNLTELNLNQNLIAKIPEWFFSSFPELVSVNLANNRLTCFNSEFRQLTQLQRLILCNNHITHIPDNIFSALSKLTILDLSNNGITSLPPSIGDLQQLEELLLQNNNISQIPSELCNLRRLQVLNLSLNSLRDLPAEFWRLEGLSVLQLTGNVHLSEPPDVIIKKGTRIILDYLKQKASGTCANADEYLRKLPPHPPPRRISLHPPYSSATRMSVTMDNEARQSPTSATSISKTSNFKTNASESHDNDTSSPSLSRTLSRLVAVHSVAHLTLPPDVTTPKTTQTTIVTKPQPPRPPPKPQRPSAFTSQSEIGEVTASVSSSNNNNKLEPNARLPAPSLVSSQALPSSITKTNVNELRKGGEHADIDDKTTTTPNNLSTTAALSGNTTKDSTQPLSQTQLHYLSEPEHNKSSTTEVSNTSRNPVQHISERLTTTESSKGTGSNAQSPSYSVPPLKNKRDSDDESVELSLSMSAKPEQQKSTNEKKSELRWFPKGDSDKISVKVMSSNYVIETGESLNFFDTFSPQNLELLEIDSFEDYTKFFYHKAHVNFAGGHNEIGPFFVSVLTEEKDSKEDGYRTLVRTPRGDYRLFLKSPSELTCENPKQVQKALLREKYQQLPWLCESKFEIVSDSTYTDDFAMLENKLVVNTLKVGVLYVKPGQTKENEMLSNDMGSEAFEEFLSFLGEKIRLKDWDKFAGGLDTKKDSTGTHAIYTTYSKVEMIFHVSTLLGNPQRDRTDPEWIQEKKVHIGNDIVVLVYLEGNQLFEPDSIISQFNHVFIVIQREPDDYRTLYRLTVVTKKGVEPTPPAIPAGSVFERSPEFRKLLLAKIANTERSAYRSLGFEGPLQRMRYHLLKDLAQRYCPDILQQIEKKVKKKERDSRRLNNGSFLNTSNTTPESRETVKSLPLFTNDHLQVSTTPHKKQNERIGESHENVEVNVDASTQSTKKRSRSQSCFPCGPKKGK